MLAPVHKQPPAVIKGRKALSLRDRMNLCDSSRPGATSCSPDAQHAGLCPAGPQIASSPFAFEEAEQPLPAVPLLASASNASNHGAGGLDHEKETADEQDRSGVGAASCMPERAGQCASSGAVHIQHEANGNEGIDTDMTQEDLRTAHETASLEHGHLAGAAQDLQQQAGWLQDDSVQQAQPGPHSSGQPRQTPMAHQQQLQQQQQQSGDANVDDNGGDDDEACWEEALEAGLLSPAEDSGQQHNQPCTESEVIQLDTESADDLLDVLADAAASTPTAGHTNR